MLTRFLSNKTRPLVYTVLICLAAIPFVQTLLFSSLVYDDNTHIFASPLLSHFNWQSFLKIWSGPYFGLYIPVTYSLWGILTLLTSKPEPFIFHLLNFSFHLLNVVLVFRLLNRFYSWARPEATEAEWTAAAFFGSLLFAIHPVQTESVAWISAFKDLGSTAFLLLCFWYYLEYRWSEVSVKHRVTGKNPKKLKWMAPSVAAKKISAKSWMISTSFYVLALLTKPNSVIAAPLLFTVNYLIFGMDWKRSLKGLGVWLIPALCVVSVTQGEQAEDLPITVSLWMRPFVSLDAYRFYLGKLAFPYGLFPDYARSIIKVVNSTSLFYMWMIPVAAFTLLFLKRDRVPLIYAAAVLWILALLPISGMIPFSFQGYSTVADRYLYFPMVFVGLALGAIFRPGVRSEVVVATVLSICTVLTTFQVSHWKDSYSLFHYAVEKGPLSSLSLNNLGMAYKNRDDFKTAQLYFEKSVAADFNNFRAVNNLGGVYYQLGLFNKADEHYSRILREVPSIYESRSVGSAFLTNYGAVLTKVGKFEESETILKKSLSLNPSNTTALMNLGEVYYHTHRYEECLKVTQKAYDLSPDNPQLQQNLAEIKKIMASR
jgi:protein O-mannosyl-transferase